MEKIIVFAPHPDDALIGCGGKIAKYLKEGNKVKIVYMTSGDAGSLEYSKEELTKIREEETKKACEVMGLKDIVFLKNPDGYLEFDKTNLINLTELIKKEKPDTVYIPHESDPHQDHYNTYKLVNEAVWRASGDWFQECKGKPWHVKTIIGYEVWAPMKNVNYVENITDYIDLKIKALKQHKSQVNKINHAEAVKGLNNYRGIIFRKGKYCECFQVLKTDKI